MKSLTLFALLVLSTFSQNILAETCSLADGRQSIEQLDCYCSPNDKSTMELKLESLNDMAEILSPTIVKDCKEAVRRVYLLDLKNKNITIDIRKKLSSLGFSIDQINDLVIKNEKMARYVQLSQSGECNKANFSITFGPFKSSSKKNPECEELKQVSQEELQYYLLSMSLNQPALKGMKAFQGDFGAMSAVENFVEQFPEVSTDKEKIHNCSLLKISLSSTLQCLKLQNISFNKIKDCKNSFLSEANILECLKKDASQETAKGCNQLFLSESNKLQCLNIGVGAQKASDCSKLYLSESNKMTCIQMDFRSELVNACNNAFLSESNKHECLQTKVSAEKINQCSSSFLSESNKLDCFHKTDDLEKIKICSTKFLSESDKLNCMSN